MKTLLTAVCLCLGGHLIATAQPQFIPEQQRQAPPPSGIQINYSAVKQTPEDARSVRFNIHLDNQNKQVVPGTVAVTIRDGKGAIRQQDSAAIDLKPGSGNLFSCEGLFAAGDTYDIGYTFTDRKGGRLSGNFAWKADPVNFFYAFTTPHRLTVSMPDSSGKTLCDVEPGKLTLLWTYDDLDFYPYNSFREIKANWRVEVEPQLDGKPFGSSTWTRTDGYLPVLENRYQRDGVSLLLEAVGGREAGIVKVTVENRSDAPRKVRLPVICPRNFKGYNPGWVDPTLPTDHLLCGWDAPADKITVLGVGADAYPTDPVMTTQLNMDWTVAPGATKTGWLLRPYDSFTRDAEKLRTTDWAAEFDLACRTWKELVAQASDVIIPDKGVANAYYAGLCDIFIMREPVGGGYLAVVPGTNGYRSAPNVLEPAIATVALDQAGMHVEAEKGYRVNWDLQTPEGDWTEPAGWGHLMWVGSGYKAWSLMEHFAHTGDTAFLIRRYPQLLANARWQHQQRKKTQVLLPDGTRPLTWGLMPKGMGDGGLKNDDSYYGIYYTHNIWPVYADSLAYKAAMILGKTDDAREMKAIFDESRRDLLTAIEKGAVTDDAGKRYLTSIPGKKGGTGSCWGLISAIFPTGLLPADNELIGNTLSHYEENMSPGGLPIHTGWMADGMWVAIALNDFAQVHLSRDDSDKANAYLYAVLNHGTPLYSWCEERGIYPGSKAISGDIQHLWTPEALMRFIRDMLVMEQDQTLHLGRGVARGWMSSGAEIGIERASTRFGDLSYRMSYDKPRNEIVGEITFADGAAPVETVVHCPMPGGMKIVKSSVGKPLADGSGFVIPAANGTVKFRARVK